jgi:hypothetical protein
MEFLIHIAKSFLNFLFFHSQEAREQNIKSEPNEKASSSDIPALPVLSSSMPVPEESMLTFCHIFNFCLLSLDQK